MEKIYLVYEYNEILEMRPDNLVGVYSSKKDLINVLNLKEIQFKEKSGRFGENAFKSKDNLNTYQIYEVDTNIDFKYNLVELYEGLSNLDLNKEEK